MKKISTAGKTPGFPLKAQKILREQQIDEHSPGTILKDFETLLDFVRSEKPQVSKAKQLLPIKMLPALNEQMSHPIKIALKRPQQKSYPNLNGLYLLLRSSGLSKIEGTGTKLRLTLDDAVYASWQSLNPTEQYLTLLEVWFLRGSPETIGESRSFWGGRISFTWKTFFERFSGTRMLIGDNKEEERSLAHFPGLYPLALLELFGFVTIEHGEPEAGQGWRIFSLQKTPLGEAFLQFLIPSNTTASDAMFELLIDYEYDGDTSIRKFGEFQPLLQDYFPEWRNNLELPHLEIREGAYTFKVSLGKSWRRIVIPGDFLLDDLSAVILDAFDFDRDHLYSFIYKNSVGRTVEVNHPYVDEGPFADEVRVQDVPLRIGGSMTFLFDFGDNWEFSVQLEGIEPVVPQPKEATLIESHGKAPEQYPHWEDERDEWEGF